MEELLSAEDLTLLDRLRQMQPWSNPRYSTGDIGNSRLFADFFMPTMRYVVERKAWYIYDGRVWKHDLGSLITMQRCNQLADLLPTAAMLYISDRVAQENFLLRVKAWHSRPLRERILKDAAVVHTQSISDFDADPMLFNCLNCTIDLRTFTSHPHRPEDMLTMMSGVNYDPSRFCDRWDAFIDEVMQPAARPMPLQTSLADEADDPFADLPSALVQKRTYLQQALGYALTGMTNQECMFILFGATTRNGKGTMMETILRMMGDYGKTAMPETIGTRPYQNSSGPREDVARLSGARFVNISEPDKKLTLSAALVKQLTGSDTITARFLHENSFEFKPQFKMFINTNYLPQITDMTLFSSGRIKIIPFERHFEPSEQDRSLKAYFAQPDHLSAILNWCLEGLNMMMENGFEEPPAIASANESYRRESDKVAQFVEEMLMPDAKGEMRTTDVYQLYIRWCELNGYMMENMKNFRKELEKHGTVVRRRPVGAGRQTSALMMLVGFRAA